MRGFRLASPCAASSQAFSVSTCQKFGKWRAKVQARGKKKVELADLLSFGEGIKRRVAKVSVSERNSSFALQ